MVNCVDYLGRVLASVVKVTFEDEATNPMALSAPEVLVFADITYRITREEISTNRRINEFS